MRKPKLRPNKDFEAKYNKIKAKPALFSYGTSSKSSMVKNKGLVAEAYEWDEEDVPLDDNDITKVKVLMALADDENVVLGKKSARNDLVFVKSSAEDLIVSIPGIEQPCLSKAEGFTLPNHDTSKNLPVESKVKIIDPLVAIINSSATEYDSVDESSFCSTPLPLLEKLASIEPVSGPKTIKSILKSNSTFKADTLKA
nr:hypothetical protein [Tanacetum cinerariifolium]